MDDHEEEGEEGEEKEEKEEKGDEKKDSGDTTAEEWLYVSQLSKLAMASPFMANMTLATVAGMWAGSGALEAFKWRKDYVISGTTTKYYAAGEYDAYMTEWWKLSDMARNYGVLAIGGMLALTSMLAALGVMPNQLVGLDVAWRSCYASGNGCLRHSFDRLRSLPQGFPRYRRNQGGWRRGHGRDRPL